MTDRVLSEQRKYWSQFCIASSQVFLGIAAAAVFTSQGIIDIGRMFVISLTLILSAILAIIGWSLIK